MRLHAPLIAAERQAGQYIILQTDDDFGERIPLTIADADTVEGSITIILDSCQNRFFVLIVTAIFCE